MSTLSVKNSTNVMIGKSVARTASVQISDPSASSTYIADGEIVVLDYQGAVLTPGKTISDSPFITLVQRSGSNLIFSARIDGMHMLAYTGKSGSAAVEQVNTLGYDGSTGTIDLTTVSKLLKITYTFDELMWSNQPMRKVYQSVSTTQAKVADDIASQMNADSYNALMASGVASSGFISAVVLSNDAAAALGAGTVSVTKGSKVIVASSASHGLTVGEWIRIGSVATTTDPVYKVTAVSGVNITVSMPYQGSTATGVTAGQITTANAATMAAGVKMTGLPLTTSINPNGDFKYLKVSFIVHPGDGFGATDNANVTAPARGNGVFEEVRELAWFAKGFEGAMYRTQVPFENTTYDAVSGTLYDTIFLNYEDGMDYAPVSGYKPARQSLYIFLADGASQQASIRAQLNPWMASLPNAFNAIGAL